MSTKRAAAFVRSQVTFYITSEVSQGPVTSGASLWGEPSGGLRAMNKGASLTCLLQHHRVEGAPTETGSAERNRKRGLLVVEPSSSVFNVFVGVLGPQECEPANTNGTFTRQLPQFRLDFPRHNINNTVTCDRTLLDFLNLLLYSFIF